MSQRSLYGDNMAVVLPSNVKDVSTMREVPDNQEVFVHPATDQSIMIEILEYVQEPDQQALKVHFDDIATSNDASDNCEILHVEQIGRDKLAMEQCGSAYLLTGQQMIAKFKEQAKNCVNIYMALYRLPHRATDILVSFNDPEFISPQSSSHLDDGAVVADEEPWNLDQFKQCVATLRILEEDFLG